MLMSIVEMSEIGLEKTRRDLGCRLLPHPVMKLNREQPYIY